MAVKSPHILLASSNVLKCKANLQSVLSKKSLKQFDDEIKANCKQLYGLAKLHFDLTTSTPQPHWRQVVSRAYYAAYNVSRALRFATKGEYSTDNSDHKKVSLLPDDFPTLAFHANYLDSLREDRNLADYDHTAQPADLAFQPVQYQVFVGMLLSDSRTYLNTRGFSV